MITENLVETSHMVRNKAREFDATASEVNMKTRAQAARVDGMVTSVAEYYGGDFGDVAACGEGSGARGCGSGEWI